MVAHWVHSPEISGSTPYLHPVFNQKRRNSMIEFLSATILMFGTCGMYNEGLSAYASEHGMKATVQKVWEEREPVDYSIMND